MTPTAVDLQHITGAHQLFCGITTYNWSLDQFRQCAQFAKAHGVDTLLIKVCEGALSPWYGGLNGWRDIRNVALAEGVGAIPYIFSYGDKYGALDTEITIMLDYMVECGIVCMNAEEAWNGQVSWAQHLCGRIQGTGTFMVSTWADPSLQNWQGVIQALAPCTTVFMPQQYNNYLATFWGEFGANGATWLQPTVNLTQDFGPNDSVTIAKNAHDQGHTAISVWYYETAVANPELLDAVYAAFPKEQPMPPAPPNLNIVQAAQDTWNSTGYLFGGPLAYDSGIAQAWQDLYINQQINMPPPTTREFASVDWNGNKITVQIFGTTRCEWDAGGQAHWYRTGI